MIDFGFVTFRTPWGTFKFSRFKVYVVVVHGPNEWNEEERRKF